MEESSEAQNVPEFVTALKKDLQALENAENEYKNLHTAVSDNDPRLAELKTSMYTVMLMVSGVISIAEGAGKWSEKNEEEHEGNGDKWERFRTLYALAKEEEDALSRDEKLELAECLCALSECVIDKADVLISTVDEIKTRHLDNVTVDRVITLETEKMTPEDLHRVAEKGSALVAFGDDNEYAFQSQLKGKADMFRRSSGPSALQHLEEIGTPALVLQEDVPKEPGNER